MRNRFLPLFLSCALPSFAPLLSQEEGGGNARRPTPMPRPAGSPGRAWAAGPRASGIDDIEEAMARHNARLEMMRLVRPKAAPRVAEVAYHPSTRIVIPWGWDRQVLLPDEAFWGRRDLFADIQAMSRAGYIPVTPLPADALSVVDVADFPAGWKAYALAVPPKGKVVLRVEHPKPAWFRIILSNKWGTREEGMLQPAGGPRLGQTERIFVNPSDSARAIYVVVDDPGWWSSKESPFTLQVERSWDPAATDVSGVKFAAGIWGAQPSVSAQYRKPVLEALGH